MKKLLYFILSMFLLIFVYGCGGGSSSTSTSSTSAGGSAQKGPFNSGSKVTAYKLINGERNTTYTITTRTIDKLGHFSFTLPWSGATEFEIEGSYFNENTGRYISGGKLSAVADVTEGATTNNININILTYIEAKRIKKLLQSGSSFEDAKDDAQKNIQKLFGISTDPSKLDLTDGSGENKADNTQLLLLSATLLNDKDPDNALNAIADDLEDGKLDQKGEGVLADIKSKADETVINQAHNNLKSILYVQNPPTSDTRSGELLLGHGLKFETKTDVEKETQIFSDPIVVKNLSSPATVTVENGSIIPATTTVSNGDMIKLSQISSDSYNTSKTTTLYIGHTPITFTTITKSDPNVIDKSPNDFSFSAKYDIKTGVIAQSEEITVSGLSDGVSTDINITDGTYSINDINQTNPSQVYNNDRVKVYLRASAQADSETNTTLSIGDKSAVFRVYSSPLDKMPDFFKPASKYNVEKGSVYITDYVTLSGFDGELDMNVSNGEVQVEGESVWKTSMQHIPRGVSVRFRQTASLSDNTRKVTSITLGNLVTSFETITAKDNITYNDKPNNLYFDIVNGAEPDSDVISPAKVITGLSAGASATITLHGQTNGYIQVNNADWVTSATIHSGDTVKLKIHTENKFNFQNSLDLYYVKNTNYYVRFGKFDVFTKAAVVQPDDFSFNSLLNINEGTYTSNTVTISGLDIPVEAKIQNALYSINSQAWISSDRQDSVTLHNGDTLRLQNTISNSDSDKKTEATVTIGNKVYSWILTLNKPPVIKNRPDFSNVTANTEISFTPLVEDEGSVTFSLENAPSWMSIDSATGEISGQAMGLYHDIKLIATDENGLSSFITFDLNANMTPYMTSDDFFKNLIVDDKSSYPKQYNLSFNIIDHDTPVSELTTTMTHEIIQSILPSTGINRGFNDSKIICDMNGNCVAQITFDFSRDDGLHPSLKTRHYITVSDGDKNTTKYVDIWFAPVAPELSGDTIQEIGFADSSESAYATYSFTPQNSGNKAESWSIQNKPVWASFDSSTGTLSGTPSLDQNGTYDNIAITATNNRGSDTFTFKIVVADKTPPKKFDFKDLVGVEINHRYEASVKVDWLASGETATVSISGYEANPNNNGFMINGAGGTTVQNGDIVTVWHISANVPDTTLKTTVTIGNDSDDFVTTTKISDSAKLPLIVGSPQTQAHLHERYSYIPQLSTDYAHFAPVTKPFEIVNKPDWAEFNTTTGELSGTPISLGEYKDIKIIAYGDNGLDDINFNITVTNEPPYIQSEQGLSLDNPDLNFTFNDNSDWRGKVTKVEYGACYGSDLVELSSSDYTFDSGILTLHASTSDKAMLRVPVMGGGKLVVSSSGYNDTEAWIDMVADGQYAVKATISPDSANDPVTEENLKMAKINLTLSNALKFKDSVLDTVNFTITDIQDANGNPLSPDGVNVTSVSYISPTQAVITLDFDGYDFDTDKKIGFTISADELNICQEVTTNQIDITAVIEPPRKVMLYPDDAGNGVMFGGAVALRGNYSAVSSNSGKVYIYEKTADGNYTQRQSFEITDESSYPHIQSLALEGSYLVVSKNDAATTGKAYLYKRDSNSNYQFVADLTPSSGLATYGNFGAKVAMSYSMIAVGYGGASGENAKVYLYEVDSYNNTVSQVAVINLSGINQATLIDEMGVDISYDTNNARYIIAAGTKSTNQNGQVELFSYSGGAVTPLSTITAVDGASGTSDGFGRSLAMSGGKYLVVGSREKQSIYLYDVSGTTPVLMREISENTTNYSQSIDINSYERIEIVVGTSANKAYSYVFDKSNYFYTRHESSLTGDDGFGERVAVEYRDVIYSIYGNKDKGDSLSGAAIISYIWDDVSRGSDTTPNSFTFVDVSDATQNQSYISNEINITGINSPAPLAVTGGEYTLDGGTTWSSAPTTVNNNQAVKLKVMSADTPNTEVNATLTVGGVSDTYTVTTSNATPPDMTLTSQNDSGVLNLSLESFDYSFADGDGSWRSGITKVYYKAGTDAEMVELSAGDYTVTDGVFTLNISSSQTPALHTPYESGGEIVIVSNDYSDLHIDIAKVESGSYSIAVNLSSDNALSEENLDGAVINLSLAYMEFEDDVLDSISFSITHAPLGVSIESINYVDPTHATLTLSYDGTDFDSDDNISIKIDKSELTASVSVVSDALSITATDESGTTMKAVDPHITGAVFWYDKNHDGVQDPHELSTLSDANGSFTFDLDIPDDANISMIVKGLHNGKPFDGNLSGSYNSENPMLSPITSLVKIGVTLTDIKDVLEEAGLAGIVEDELIADPFDISLLPWDGNMSNSSDEDIEKYKRELVANVAVNAVMMAVGSGYELTPEEIYNIFTMQFSIGSIEGEEGEGEEGAEGEGEMQQSSLTQIIVGSAEQILTEANLRGYNARVVGRIYVTVANYFSETIRDNIVENGGEMDGVGMVVGELMQKLPNVIEALINSYIDMANLQAWGVTILDPKIEWIKVGSHYRPMWMVGIDELAGINVKVKLSYNNAGTTKEITFDPTNHQITGDDINGAWVIDIANRKVMVDSGFEIYLNGNSIRINGSDYQVIESEVILNMGSTNFYEEMPTLLSVTPTDGSKNIDVNTTVRFHFQYLSDILKNHIFCTMTKDGSFAQIAFNMSFDNYDVVLTPSSDLLYNTSYNASCSLSYGDDYALYSTEFDTKLRYTPITTTGQTTVYTSGDDGSYTKGVDMSTRSRDDTTEVVTDSATNLKWLDVESTELKTIASAKLYCSSLSPDGVDTWRLPTSKEMQSLMDFGADSVGDIAGFTNLESDWYWTSTQTIDSTNYGDDEYIKVRLPDSIYVDSETIQHRVICVRNY